MIKHQLQRTRALRLYLSGVSILVMTFVIVPLACAISGTQFYQEAKLVTPNGYRLNGVGRAVDIKGDRSIVGAIGSNSGGSPYNAASIFDRDAQGWHFAQQLVPLNLQASTATFGISVAVEGTTAIVGADLDGETVWQSGAVYTFEKGPTGFAQAQKIFHPESIMDGNFGRSIDLDGNTLIVGAPGLTGGSPPPAAYAFTKQNGLWTLQSKLVPVANANKIETFGYSVAVSGDFAVIGDEGDFTQGFFHRGAARVFHRTGTTWAETQQLMAFDTNIYHGFGEAVSISGDTIAVGAPGDDDLGYLAGAVYIYRFNGSTWGLEQKIKASDGVADDSFGRQLSLYGNTLVVGEEANDGAANSGGAAYVFQRSGSSWTQTSKLFSADIATDNLFGHSVAVDNGQFITGATNASPFGAAYVFVVPEPSAVLLTVLAICGMQGSRRNRRSLERLLLRT